MLTISSKVNNEKHTKHAVIKGKRRCKPTSISRVSKRNFYTSLLINSSVINVLVNAGADVNVISEKEARNIDIKRKKCKLKLRQYGSKPLKVCGKYTGSIKFADNVL